MGKLENTLTELQNHAQSPDLQKKILRKKLLDERKELRALILPESWGPKQFFRALALLNAKNLDELQKKYLVASYFPIRDELDLAFFANENVVFPRIAEKGELLWFPYGDGKTGYEKNIYGIRERQLEFCFTYKQSMLPMLCFVPALAASQDGYRLGYGGGYYDGFLAQFPDKVTSVVCLPSPHFLFDFLPTESFDRKVDLVVWA